MRRIVVILMVFSVLVAAGTLGLDAQPDDLEPIFINTGLQAYQWSADGQTFVFGDGPQFASRELEQGFWFQYDINTQQMTSITSWPLQPMLTAQEFEAFHPYPNSFIFESPSKNYLAYAAELNPELFNSLAVAERSTLNLASFNDKVIHTPTAVGSELGSVCKPCEGN